MPIFLNPFRKYDVSDFEGVLVPLADVERHPSFLASQGEKTNLGPEAANESATEIGAQTGQHSGGYSIQSLRAEIDTGMLYDMTPSVDVDELR